MRVFVSKKNYRSFIPRASPTSPAEEHHVIIIDNCEAIAYVVHDVLDDCARGTDGRGPRL